MTLLGPSQLSCCLKLHWGNTRRYGSLPGPTSSSCGGLRPRFFFPSGEKRLLTIFTVNCNSSVWRFTQRLLAICIVNYNSRVSKISNNCAPDEYAEFFGLVHNYCNPYVIWYNTSEKSNKVAINISTVCLTVNHVFLNVFDVQIYKYRVSNSRGLS